MAQRPSMAKDLTPPSGTFSFFLLAFLLTLTGQGLVVAGLWRFLEAGASGLQTSVLTLVQALASILTPFLLQSWLETRPQMVLRLLAFGLGVAALLALGSPGLSTFLLLYAALLALFLFLTAALAIYGVLLGSALPRLFPKEALSQANARWEMANTLGLVLAPLIGGFAVDRLGPYALPLFALPLGVALVLLLGLKAPPPLGPSEGRRKAFGGVPLGVLLPVALPALLPALALTGGGVLTALLFHDLKRPEGLGIAWAGFSLGGFLVAQALTRVSLPPVLGLLGGLGLLGLGNLGNGLLRYPHLLLGSLVSGAGVSVARIAFRTFLQRLAPPETLVGLFAYVNVLTQTARVLGSPLGGGLGDLLGPRGAFVAFGSVFLLASLLFPPLLRLSQRVLSPRGDAEGRG